MSYHLQTEHTYKSVRMNSSFLDWGTQPSAFKSYPKFYPRFKLDISNPLDNTIVLSGKITFEKKYGQDSYLLRSWPSAGALYPIEMYVQMRGVEGKIDGIYHFEPRSESIVLLRELNGDGIEVTMGLDYDVKGALFLFGSPYFRSSWKYKNRAFRYCLLDCGHCYGSLEASAYANNLECNEIFCFDKPAMCDLMGFENKEFALLAAVVGEKKEQKSKKIIDNLPFVSATDYFERNSFIEDAYASSCRDVASDKGGSFAHFDFEGAALSAAIESRRSIRAFYGHSISNDEFLRIMSIRDLGLDIYAVVNNVDGIEQGLYKDGVLLKEGNFSQKAGYLCLEQALGSKSTVTFFVASNAKDYQSSVINAGIFGHRVYIYSTMLGIGVSGIGAYYDKEVKEFLETNSDILYALAIGR